VGPGSPSVGAFLTGVAQAEKVERMGLSGRGPMSAFIYGKLHEIKTAIRGKKEKNNL